MFTSNKLQSIKTKSAAAIGVFQKTVSDLAAVNKEIDAETERRQKQIDTLKAEQIELDTVALQNSKFIGKLNEFLGLEG